VHASTKRKNHQGEEQKLDRGHDISQSLCHFNDWKRFAVFEGDGDLFDGNVAFERVERDAGYGGAHFVFVEAGGAGGCFYVGEDEAAEALAGEGGVDEDGADFGGVGCWVEEFGFSDRGSVGAEEGFALGPASAAGQRYLAIGVCRFDDVVGLVADELGVEAEDGAEGAFDLGGGVVVGLQAADGGFDEGVEGWDVFVLGEADVPVWAGGGHGEFRVFDERTRLGDLLSHPCCKMRIKDGAPQHCGVREECQVRRLSKCLHNRLRIEEI